jgi:hypothetical protein
MKFTSSDDLARLPETDPAYPVISKLVQGLITDDNLIIALAESTDTDIPSHTSASTASPRFMMCTSLYY